MPIDLKPFSEQIRLWERARDIAKEINANPELLKILLQSINGSNRDGEPAPGKPTPTLQLESTDDVPRGSRGPHGYFLETVARTIDLFNDEFTTHDIEQELISRQFVFRTAKPNVGINEALRTLEERRYVERTGKRKGLQIIWKKRTGSAVESRTA